jgi:hypothetical protein
MSERVWSSEERRVALEQVSRMISGRVEKARERRGEVSVEACEDHQAMQVAIELQCRLTEIETMARRALDRANRYMDRVLGEKCFVCGSEATVSFSDLDTGLLAEYCQRHAPKVA